MFLIYIEGRKAIFLQSVDFQVNCCLTLGNISLRFALGQHGVVSLGTIHFLWVKGGRGGGAAGVFKKSLNDIAWAPPQTSAYFGMTPPPLITQKIKYLPQ